SAVFLVTTVIGIVWVFLGVSKYGLWNDAEGPMSGFFPTIVGSALIFFSIIGFLQSLTQGKVKFEKSALLIVGSVAMILILNYLIGLLPALLIFYVLYLKLIEKYSWKTTIIATVFFGGIVYGAFKVWLGVPFPKGLLFSLIWR
ncbi:MAG: tripartite tricarboxylate transporter TctB family protein, partial [Candidatus Ornithospirochaeta sp.]